MYLIKIDGSMDINVQGKKPDSKDTETKAVVKNPALKLAANEDSHSYPASHAGQTSAAQVAKAGDAAVELGAEGDSFPPEQNKSPKASSS